MKGTALLKKETISKTEKGYILICLQIPFNITIETEMLIFT